MRASVGPPSLPPRDPGALPFLRRPFVVSRGGGRLLGRGFHLLGGFERAVRRPACSRPLLPPCCEWGGGWSVALAPMAGSPAR
eukprot:1151457-Prymnesium_polylepis.1